MESENRDKDRIWLYDHKENTKNANISLQIMCFFEKSAVKSEQIMIWIFLSTASKNLNKNFKKMKNVKNYKNDIYRVSKKAKYGVKW